MTSQLAEMGKGDSGCRNRWTMRMIGLNSWYFQGAYNEVHFYIPPGNLQQVAYMPADRRLALTSLQS